MWYIYIMDYYSANQNNDFMDFLGMCTELENIMLSEVTQSQKKTHGMDSLINVYEYTVTVFRHSRKGHWNPLQMVVNHHVVAGN